MSGGKRYSTLDLYTEDNGGATTAGARIWAGQHNVEAFGDRIYMFDNAYERNASSRLLRLRVDAAAGTATVDWVYEIPFPYPYGYSEVYGDADLLPSGNVLTNWWPQRLSPSRGVDADLYVWEVTRDRAVAWELAVFNSGATVGGACDDDAEASPVGGDGPCDRQINLGWKAYSVERFYDAPVVDGGAETEFAGSGRPDATLKLASLAQNEVFVARSWTGAHLCSRSRGLDDLSRHVCSKWTMLNVS